jgi:hypothetical protein
MPPTSLIAQLVVLTGLASAAQAAPVPPPEVAEAQLRAINHRLVDAFAAGGGGDFIDRLTAEDFVLTTNDGAWRNRTDFVVTSRRSAIPTFTYGTAPTGGW